MSSSSGTNQSKLGVSATSQPEGSQPDEVNHVLGPTAQEARVVRKLDLHLMTLFFALCKSLDVCCDLELVVFLPVGSVN